MKINEHGHKTQWAVKQELKILFETLESQIRTRIQMDKDDTLPHCLNTLQAIKDRIIL